MFSAAFNTASRRLCCTYIGFWTVAEARRVYEELRSHLKCAAAEGRPFTVLDDLSDYGVQTAEVFEINLSYAEMYGDFEISRNAMIIPSALVRTQVRRTLVNLNNCEVFPSFAEADIWLAEVEPGSGDCGDSGLR